MGDCPGSGVVVPSYFDGKRCECDDCEGDDALGVSKAWCPVCDYAVNVEPVEPAGTTPRFRIVRHGGADK